MHKKAAGFFILFILTVKCLFSSVPTTAYGYNDLTFSATANTAYTGRLDSAIINPANLARIDNDDLFYFTFIVSESWDLDEFRELKELYGLQNLNTEVQVSFVGANFAISAFSSTYFAERILSDSGLSYDIYNRLGIQLDWSGKFDVLSAGIRIKGGGDLRRRNRNITGFFSAFENAYFGSFDNVDGSEHFSVGAAIGLNFELVALSYYVEDIISYRGNQMYYGLDVIRESSILSISLRYPKYTSMGNLNLFRPRLGIMLEGDPFTSSIITYNLDVEMQLLPNLSLRLAAAYKEYDHYFFRYNSNNGVLFLSFSVERNNYSLSFMCNVDTAKFSRIYPSFSFTVSR